jgi:hypothetical protein
VAEAVSMVRSVAGRTVLLDLHLVGVGKLDELIQQCVQVSSKFLWIFFFYFN